MFPKCVVARVVPPNVINQIDLQINLKKSLEGKKY